MRSKFLVGSHCYYYCRWSSCSWQRSSRFLVLVEEVAQKEIICCWDLPPGHLVAFWTLFGRFYSDLSLESSRQASTGSGAVTSLPAAHCARNKSCVSFLVSQKPSKFWVALDRATCIQNKRSILKCSLIIIVYAPKWSDLSIFLELRDGEMSLGKEIPW